MSPLRERDLFRSVARLALADRDRDRDLLWDICERVIACSYCGVKAGSTTTVLPLC